jgi:hypothetical protein
LSARCAPLAQLPLSATIPEPAISAHVSLANCIAEESMNRVVVSPTDGAIGQLNSAVAPSLAMLDEVSRLGDPYWKAIAEDAKRDVYSSMVVRVRASIPTPGLAAESAVEPKLVGWIDNANRAEAEVAMLAERNPDVAMRDPVIASIVDRTRADVPAAVAQRPQAAQRTRR